tara:strand:- start:343 stop:855 length:513 start_codon:yes stop_codon:yes gene_type:complete
MLIFDIETNGLLEDLTEIHCLAVYNTKTGETESFNDQPGNFDLITGVQYLEDADCIVGHHILGFDIPAIQKVYPWFTPPRYKIDTLLMSRLIHPNIMDIDKKRQWQHMPLQMYGKHSLASYGYRLGEYKGEFGQTTDWSAWSEEMEEYCIQDVKVTTKLFEHFKNNICET